MHFAFGLECAGYLHAKVDVHRQIAGCGMVVEKHVMAAGAQARLGPRKIPYLSSARFHAAFTPSIATRRRTAASCVVATVRPETVGVICGFSETRRLTVPYRDLFDIPECGRIDRQCLVLAMFGAIEAGGTKFVCGVGTSPDDIVTMQIPTTSPEETLARTIAWFREHSRGELRAVGIGSFGPVELNADSGSWGFITSTPKVAWRNFDLAGAVGRGLGVPVRFDTDVNVAVLGEARWGAARGVSNCLYLTVGTGIGGGAIVEGRVLHGLTHPEMGHVRVPHDWASDPFAGVCPYHGDCLEGLASGPAIARVGE
jgi:hypothetical protein